MSGELKAQEIFSSGSWNGITFSDADLDGMVRAFDALGLAGKVPLKFGHDSAKPVKDGKPALGWISRMYREGRKLLADFSNVPDAVMTAIREKLYKHVSIELLQNVKAGTREIPWVPDAVALLGADQPAVGILKELEALTMSSRTALRFGARVAFKRDYHQQTGEQSTMTEAEIAELRARLAAAEADTAKFKSESESVKAEREAERKAAHKAKLEGIVEAAIEKREAAPAARNLFKSLTGNGEAIMNFTAEQIVEWVKTCAPMDKPLKAKMTTEDGKMQRFIADTNAQAYELAVADEAKALGYEPKEILSDAGKAQRVFSRVQFTRPALYKAYVADPAGEYKDETNEEAA